MSLLDKLKERGWHLTESGLQKLREQRKSSADLDEREAIRLAKDSDFKEVAGGAFPSDLNKGGERQLAVVSFVVQLVKTINVSAPRSNQESKAAPQMLKMTLTDGQTTHVALEWERIQELTLNTPPGTKILLKNGPIKMQNGMLWLTPRNVEVLGGKVTALFEKWQTQKELSKMAKGGRPNFGANGPPRWIPFGQEIPQNLKTDEPFNSMVEAQTKYVPDTAIDNSEFNSQRNDAISEAIKTENKKVFGGGTKQLMDASVQKIVERGYTEEQAKNALRYNRNNVEQAINSLRRGDRSRGVHDGGERTMEDRKQPAAMGGAAPMKKGAGGGRAERMADKMDKTDVTAAKPSGTVSLFDFLEEKLPQGAEQPAAQRSGTAPAYNRRSDGGSGHYGGNQGARQNGGGGGRFENNISASFASRQKRPENRNSGPSYYQHQQQDSRGGYKGGYQRDSYNNYSGGSGGGQRDNYSRDYNKGGRDNYQHPSQHSAGGQSRYQKDQRNEQPPRNNYYDQSYKTNTYPGGGRNQQQQQHQQPPPQRQVGPSSSSSALSSAQPKPKQASSAYNKPPPSTASSSSTPSLGHIVDATAAMKISPPAQIPPSPQPTPPAPGPPGSGGKSFIQLPNGSSYNPYQIMGFQNKATNEFAMNVLKTQQMPQGPPPPQGVGVPTQVVPGAPFVAAPTVAYSPHPPVLSSPAVYPMQAFPPPLPVNWNVGDICLSKYWEDRRFYPAEITGISDSTFVVRFIDYGNYEEVLKMDCVPFTGNPPPPGPPTHPPPAATFGPVPIANRGAFKPQPPQHQPMQAAHNVPHHHHQVPPQQQQQQRSNKSREQRSMYVPPAQRKP